MKLFKVIAIVCLTLVVSISASPVPQANNDDNKAEFLRRDELPLNEKESVKVKRRIYEENNDGHLKQISLSSLIGDLQQGLFASALNVNKVLTDTSVNVPEIKPNEANLSHDVNKRHSLNKEATASDETTSTVATTKEAGNKVILQTTEKVPESNGKPAHIVIDRIAIQPHTGGVAFIPIFELKRTINDNNATKDREVTKITISKTEITSLANLPAPAKLVAEEKISSSTIAATTTESSLTTIDYNTDATTDSYIDVTTINSNIKDDTSSTTTPTSTASSTLSTSTSTEKAVAVVATTAKNIEQLKEAEEDLKEKVAEIEAEPVILTARV